MGSARVLMEPVKVPEGTLASLGALGWMRSELAGSLGVGRVMCREPEAGVAPSPPPPPPGKLAGSSEVSIPTGLVHRQRGLARVC